jgi:hypothetical protein
VDFRKPVSRLSAFALQPRAEVVMVWEIMHAYRVIPLDGRPHLDAKTRLYMGDSRGYCEGDTRIDQVVNSHSDAIHLIERSTPLDSNKRPWKIAYFYSRFLDPKFESIQGGRYINNR